MEKMTFGQVADLLQAATKLETFSDARHPAHLRVWLGDEAWQCMTEWLDGWDVEKLGDNPGKFTFNFTCGTILEMDTPDRNSHLEQRLWQQAVERHLDTCAHCKKGW